VYGTQGVPAASNVPGSRFSAVGWTAGGNLWLFGGNGTTEASDGKETSGDLNDLWEFNPNAGTWEWVSGSSTIQVNSSGLEDMPGVYGTMGVPSPANVPGPRSIATGAADGSNLWLFGGNGFDSTGTQGYLNDLWKFSFTTHEWTWVSGSSTMQSNVFGDYGDPGIYGTQGVPSPGNVPGGRGWAVSWVDSTGNFWLFGGVGFDSTGMREVSLNDLWEFNPITNEWTWVSGSNTVGASLGQPGVYGTQGIPSATNVPGGRIDAASWTDTSGNLWLFGGGGFDSTGTNGSLNDLWELNPTTKTWVWVSGSNTANAAGVYGSQGATSASNVPGARHGAIGWADSSGNLWLFGGNAVISDVFFNDLWEFNPSTKTWIWVSGADTANELGVYGTKGVPDASNVPGSRRDGVGWTDASGNFWLFGGAYIPSQVPSVIFNDLWRYQP